MGIFSSLFTKAGNPELKALVKEAFLVDVRTPGEFSEGSAEGAVNIPLDNLSRQLEKFRGKQKIVVFCRSGSRSAEAKNILERNGFNNVINGGTWQNVQQAISS